MSNTSCQLIYDQRGHWWGDCIKARRLRIAGHSCSNGRETALCLGSYKKIPYRYFLLQRIKLQKFRGSEEKNKYAKTSKRTIQIFLFQCRMVCRLGKIRGGRAACKQFCITLAAVRGALLWLTAFETGRTIPKRNFFKQKHFSCLHSLMMSMTSRNLSSNIQDILYDCVNKSNVVFTPKTWRNGESLDCLVYTQAQQLH